MTTVRPTVLPARALALSAAVILGGALVAGCGSSGSTTSSSTTAAPTPASSPSTATLAVVDPWVKAQPSNMTGFFGVLKNSTDKEITVVSGSSPVAGTVEMHEVAMVDGAMKMRKKEGGFVVPANGSLELKPGGNHIMLMEIKNPITAGQSVAITLTTADGQELSATGVAKTIAGGNESYASDGPSPSMTMSASS